MTTELTVKPQSQHWDEKQMSIIRNTICKNCSDDEISLFSYICQRTGLDPFARQIYAVKRGNSMTIQTGIDGFRLIGERTNKYAPGKEYTHEYDKNGILLKATAYIKKMTPDGTWHEVSASAYWDEYAQMYNGKPSQFWAKMPHLMLGKCFTPDTEILTINGFERLDNLKSEVLQYENGDLSPVKVKAFKQTYDGDMISCHSDMVNFMVTPNHDMVTTFGKVEAGAMYETSDSRGPWKIPMTTGNQLQDLNPNVALIGYILADGYFNGNEYKIAVSKQKKVDILSLCEAKNVYVSNCKNNVAYTKSRNIKTNFDKIVYTFPYCRVEKYLDKDKRFINLSNLNKYECRTILEAWQYFDGYTNKKTGVKRIYTSRLDHVKFIEVLAVKAGYSISKWNERTSDISDRPNWFATLSEPDPIPVYINGTHSSLIKEKNPFSEVWCVTVPSGKIVVRRNGFSMICGNCAEALALRKAFPADLSGIYTDDEMAQADNKAIDVKPIDSTPDPEVKPEVKLPEKATDAHIKTMDSLVEKYPDSIQKNLEVLKAKNIEKNGYLTANFVNAQINAAMSFLSKLQQENKKEIEETINDGVPF